MLEKSGEEGGTLRIFYNSKIETSSVIFGKCCVILCTAVHIPRNSLHSHTRHPSQYSKLEITTQAPISIARNSFSGTSVSVKVSTRGH